MTSIPTLDVSLLVDEPTGSQPRVPEEPAAGRSETARQSDLFDKICVGIVAPGTQERFKLWVFLQNLIKPSPAAHYPMVMLRCARVRGKMNTDTTVYPTSGHLVM